ncbi:MAG: hypothetical protein JWL81_1196 [Verrucomicrobiales bacterium]|nr:hypothetical protein [Verrucomicrobiales bacterium]
MECGGKIASITKRLVRKSFLNNFQMTTSKGTPFLVFKVMKTTIPVLLLMSVLSLPVWAAPVSLGTVKLLDGRQFEDVKVMKVEPDGLRIEHKAGVGKVKLEDLPDAVARQFSLDETTASEFRMREKLREDGATDARRRAQVRALLETSKVGQDAQARSTRIAIFDQSKANRVNYASLDSQLLEQVELWKAAGRDDLAATFEEDRQLFRQQEITHPAAEREALERRVRELQSDVDRARSQPPVSSTSIVVRQDPYSYPNTYPYSKSRYYYPTSRYYYPNGSPYYYPNYGPTNVINYYTPSSSYNHNPRPSPSSPYCPPSVVRPQPSYRPPVMVNPNPAPRPMTQGNPVHGSHLWKK